MEDFNNPHFICATAKDFLEKSSIGAKGVYNGQITGDVAVLGQLSFPMVTVAFSMELALKGLLKHSRIEFGNIHDLKRLFYLLAEEDQNKIIEHYGRHDKFKGYPNMYLAVGDKENPTPPPSLPEKLPPIGDHVKAILERHKYAFIDFRYLHEFGIRKQELGMDYNFFANLTYSIISVLAIKVGYPISED